MSDVVILSFGNSDDAAEGSEVTEDDDETGGGGEVRGDEAGDDVGEVEKKYPIRSLASYIAAG